jgi:hypothetical protein
MAVVPVIITIKPTALNGWVIGVYFFYVVIYLIALLYIPAILAYLFGRGKFSDKTFQVSSYIFVGLITLSVIVEAELNVSEIRYGKYCEKNSSYFSGRPRARTVPTFELNQEHIVIGNKSYAYELNGKIIHFLNEKGIRYTYDLRDYVECN